jgi:hypothetical protein
VCLVDKSIGRSSFRPPFVPRSKKLESGHASKKRIGQDVQQNRAIFQALLYGALGYWTGHAPDQVPAKYQYLHL